jgi:hypothetical protein
LGFNLLGEFCAGIISSIIVIVPCGEYRTVFLDALVTGLLRKLLVFCPEFPHICCIPVYIVSQEDKQVRVCLDNRVPDGLGVELFCAGTKGDILQWSFCSRQTWIAGGKEN